MCLPLRIYDDWEKFNETSLPKIIDFNSYLNMEDITDPDYVHSKIVCKDFFKKTRRIK